MPLVFPWASASSSSFERVLFQSIVSFAVTASDRNVSPAATAFLTSRREKPPLVGRSSTTTGMFDQPEILCSFRNDDGTQGNCAPAGVTASLSYCITPLH